MIYFTLPTSKYDFQDSPRSETPLSDHHHPPTLKRRDPLSSNPPLPIDPFSGLLLGKPPVTHAELCHCAIVLFALQFAISHQFGLGSDWVLGLGDNNMYIVQ